MDRVKKFPEQMRDLFLGKLFCTVWKDKFNITRTVGTKYCEAVLLGMRLSIII